MSRARLDKQPHDVAGMFDETAGRYDLMNDIMTAGIDRLWRRATVAAIAARPGERVLDIAAGTGFSSEPVADAGVDVVPADFSLGMLKVGAHRRPDLPFTAADATALPFASDSFDAVSISYGLRNVVDTDGALSEFRRVTKPGGRLVINEFSRPVLAPMATVYYQGIMRALPALAQRFSSNPDSYVYLAESIREWPDQRALADRLTAAGWTGVRWRNLTGGIVALHTAHKPV